MVIDQIINLGSKNIVTLEIAGEIVELAYPSQVAPNTPFDISYGAKNISTIPYTFFGYLEDEIGVIPGTEWQKNINPGDTYYPPILTHPGITEPMTLTLTLGHREELIPPPEVPWVLIAIGASFVAVAITVYVVAKKRKG